VASSLGFGASWRRCPICFEDFSLKEVKPVRFVAQTDLCDTGGWIEFVLRKMPQDHLRMVDTFSDLNPLERITRISDDFFRTEVVEAEEVELFRLITESDQFDAELLKVDQYRPALVQDKKSPFGIKMEKSHPSSIIYFHQAADGQALFFHPLCIRML
jgi:hypothetical protein